MNLSVIDAPDGLGSNCPEKVTSPLALMLGIESSISLVGVLDVDTEVEEMEESNQVPL